MERASTATGVASGVGMAVCLSRRLVVTLNWGSNQLSVFCICADGTIAYLYTTAWSGGWHGSSHGYSGWPCFTHDTIRPTLLVPVFGNGRVQEWDVTAVDATHVGFPIVIGHPRAVAASVLVIAVCAWEAWNEGDHVVSVYDATTRAPLHVIGHGYGAQPEQLNCPYGLRLSADGKAVVVCDFFNNRVSMFSASDGAWARTLASDMSYPWDVEEYENGWLVACTAPASVWYVDMDARRAPTQVRDTEGIAPAAVSVVPSVGVIFRASNLARRPR